MARPSRDHFEQELRALQQDIIGLSQKLAIPLPPSIHAQNAGFGACAVETGSACWRLRDRGVVSDRRHDRRCESLAAAGQGPAERLGTLVGADFFGCARERSPVPVSPQRRRSTTASSAVQVSTAFLPRVCTCCALFLWCTFVCALVRGRIAHGRRSNHATQHRPLRRARRTGSLRDCESSCTR